MYNRREYRKVVLQTLYEIDSNFSMNINILDGKNILERNIREFLPDSKENDFAVNLFTTVFERASTLDDIIAKAAPEWPIEKINLVDRNVLRIGLSEMIFGEKNNVPPKVAIDEAIEIAKEFGGDTSGKFVNGVLGAVYKELDIKEDKSKINSEEVVKKNLKKEESRVGAIIFASFDDENYILCDEDRFRHVTFIKGEKSEGETDEEFLIDYTKKETGIDIFDAKYIDHYSYISHHPTEGNIYKKVDYYSAFAMFNKIENKDNSANNYKWININDIEKVKIYKDLRPILDIAMKNFLVDTSEKIV